MLAAARKHKRVVQVGTQRRSTPHLIEARDRVIKEGKLGKIGLRRDLLLLPHAGHAATRPTPPRPSTSTTRCGPARPRCGPTTRMVHPRGWRAFMEYGNGIVGDMCIHMLDMVRWMLDLGWPKRVSSTGGILVDKDEQGQHHRHADRHLRLRRPEGRLDSTAPGAKPPDPKYPWGATFYGDKGTLKASVIELRLHPAGPRARPDPRRRRSTSSSKYPEDKTEKDLERHVRLGHPRAHEGLPRGIASRGKPVADIEQGYISTSRCILANLCHEARPHADLGPAGRQVVGDDEANRLLRRPYRAPWIHPDPDRV